MGLYHDITGGQRTEPIAFGVNISICLLETIINYLNLTVTCNLFCNAAFRQSPCLSIKPLYLFIYIYTVYIYGIFQFFLVNSHQCSSIFPVRPLTPPAMQSSWLLRSLLWGSSCPERQPATGTVAMHSRNQQQQQQHDHNLVCGFNLLLWKMMDESSVGMMTFPTEWKNNPNVPNHQSESDLRSNPVFNTCFVWQSAPCLWW